MQIKLVHKRIKIKAGDCFGFTWLKYGVVRYDRTKQKGVFREANRTPKLGKSARYGIRHGSRVYSIQGLYRAKRKIGKQFS